MPADLAALTAAVPWWVWAITLSHLGCAGVFSTLYVGAPLDTTIWPGGEPRPHHCCHLDSGKAHR